MGGAGGGRTGPNVEGEASQSEHSAATAKPGTCLVSIGPGLPSLPKRLVERIGTGECVDFGELPPAKGKSRPLPQAGEGQVVVVQATDLMATRKTIPDLVTWLQCFGIFTAVVAAAQPKRVPELMAYQAIIAKASQTYRWPSWVVYDQAFRQEMAGAREQSWAKVDPSLYSVCFFGQNINAENWCSVCRSLEHTATACPSRATRKCTWPGSPARGANQEVCQKYNRFNGDCRYGRDCKFAHMYSRCGEPHPVTKCKAGNKHPRQEE